MTRFPPTSSLKLAVGLLLPSTAPSSWVSAVREAARILAPSWTVPAGEMELRALALLFYARTWDGRRAPAAVTMDELRAAVDVTGTPMSYGVMVKEPAVAAEIKEAVREAGHEPTFSGPQATSDRDISQIWLLSNDLCNQYSGSDALDDECGPGPSALRHCVPTLAEVLGGVTEDDRQNLAPVEAATGVLRIATPRVMVTRRNAWVPVNCSVWDCRTADAGQLGELTVDGLAVVWTCAHGHDTPVHGRGQAVAASRVRLGLWHLGYDQLTDGELVITPTWRSPTRSSPSTPVQGCATRFPGDRPREGHVG